MSGGDFFLDTNILVYSFDPMEPRKRDTSRSLIVAGLETDRGCISYQVIQEFLNLTTRKFPSPMSTEAARKYLGKVLTPLCRVFSSIDLFERALEIHQRWQYAYYDSLIIAAALQAGCKILYSEDLHHNQAIEGLIIQNPYLEG